MKFIKSLYFFIGILALPFSHCFAQQDTLYNIPDNTALTSYKYSSTCAGYYAGHNCYGRETYAEKYYISGTASISGIISIHTGIVQMPDRLATFEVYKI